MEDSSTLHGLGSNGTAGDGNQEPCRRDAGCGMRGSACLAYLSPASTSSDARFADSSAPRKLYVGLMTHPIRKHGTYLETTRATPVPHPSLPPAPQHPPRSIPRDAFIQFLRITVLPIATRCVFHPFYLDAVCKPSSLRFLRLDEQPCCVYNVHEP